MGEWHMDSRLLPFLVKTSFLASLTVDHSLALSYISTMKRSISVITSSTTFWLGDELGACSAGVTSSMTSHTAHAVFLSHPVMEWNAISDFDRRGPRDWHMLCTGR